VKHVSRLRAQGLTIAAATSIAAHPAAQQVEASLQPQGLAAGNPIDRVPPLYIATIAVVAGDAIGNARIAVPIWIAITIAIVAVFAFLRSRAAIGICAAFIAIVAAATIPANQLLTPAMGPASLDRFAEDSVVTIEGRLVREPEHPGGDRTYLYIGAARAGSDPTNLTPATGIVRVMIRGSETYRIGDEVRAIARIRYPRNDGNPGEFDYRAWLLRNRIVATMSIDSPKRGRPPALVTIAYHASFPASQIESVREHIGRFIDANLDYPESAEMRALIIGDRGGIDEALRQRFALTGMAHLLVISGLHLGIVAAAAFFVVRMAMGLFPTLMARGYANKFAAAAAATAAAAYASIAGNHVSTMRALVMVLAYAFAIVIDQSRELLSSLALAALVICLAIPGSTADIGFQLSFASVIAILIGMRRFAAWWRIRYAHPLAPPVARSRAHRIGAAIAGYVALSFWALVGTAPLTAFHFNQFSIVGIVANAIVVPIMGFGAVVCGLIAAALNFIWMGGASEVLWLAGRLASVGTWLAGWFLDWPLAWTRIFTPTILEIALAYGLITLWLIKPLADADFAPRVAQAWNDPARRNAIERSRRWRERAALALLVAITVDACYWIRQRYFNPELRVTFIAVGQGDSALVRFPGSRVMLIDGGGAFGGTFDPGERIVAPYLWSQKIMHVDYVAVSHPDRDHFGGLIFIVRNFAPTEFWSSGVGSTDESYARLIDAVSEMHARTMPCNAVAPGRTIGGAEVRCLWPAANALEAKDNNLSAVIRVGYRGQAILFAGDLEAKGERELIATGADLHAAILKAPHHGSATSSSAALIEAVRPEAAVMSLGWHNQFHFPAGAVVERYREAGVEVLRTDELGAISADVGPDGIDLRSYRGGYIALPPVGPANPVR
jgi:competence protein ComEC